MNIEINSTENGSTKVPTPTTTVIATPPSRSPHLSAPSTPMSANHSLSNPSSTPTSTNSISLPAPATPVSHLVSRSAKDNDSNGDDTESIDSNSSRKVDSSPRTVRNSTPKRNITLLTLVQAELLQPGPGVFTVEYLGKKVSGDLLECGKILWNDQKYDLPSSWATVVKKQINPAKKSGCGWNSVKYKGKKLDKIKLDYVKMMQAKNAPPTTPSPAPSVNASEEDIQTNITNESTSEQFSPTFQQFVPVPYLDPDMALKTSKYDSHQLFSIFISRAALALINFHNCLSTTVEMSGYLGGTWNQDTKTLTILKAFPCRCQTEDPEEVQLVIENEIETAMNVKKLAKIGWYHSHPTAPANPTLCDLELHTQLQAQFQPNHPFVMLINSPFLTPEQTSTASEEATPPDEAPDFKVVWQCPSNESKSGGSDPVELLYEGTPVEMSYTVLDEPGTTEDQLNHMKLLLDFVRERGLSVNFSNEFCDGETYLDKLKSAVKDHVMDEKVLEMLLSLLPKPEEQIKTQVSTNE